MVGIVEAHFEISLLCKIVSGLKCIGLVVLIADVMLLSGASSFLMMGECGRMRASVGQCEEDTDLRLCMYPIEMHYVSSHEPRVDPWRSRKVVQYLGELLEERRGRKDERWVLQWLFNVSFLFTGPLEGEYVLNPCVFGILLKEAIRWGPEMQLKNEHVVVKSNNS